MRTIPVHAFGFLKRSLAVLLSVFMIIMVFPSADMGNVLAASSDEDQFRQELKTMIESGNQVSQDLSKYKITTGRANEIFKELQNGECALSCAAYGFCYLGMKSANGLATTITVYGTDAKNYASNYSKITTKANQILSGIEPNMTQAEKALYIHDKLVDSTNFQNSGSLNRYYAAGPLVNGYGVCQGYANAYKLLLSQAGINAQVVSSDKMNHAWDYVEIDGNWYHVDATWDDTRSSQSGTASHQFFLLNDKEVQNKGSNSHYDWKVAGDSSLTSTSSDYSDSVVHSVTGDMYYSNGIWYYTSGKNIMVTTLDESTGEVAYTADSNVSIKSVVNGVVTYTSSGITSEYSMLSMSESKAVAVPQTAAEFYVIKRGGSRTNYNPSNYYSLGSGTIVNATKIQGNDAAVEADLGTIPDTSALLASTEKIVWYSIKLVGTVWHVDGEIVRDTENTDAATGTSANFYLVKEGGSRTNYDPSNYYSLGTGTIKNAVKVQNDDAAVVSNIGTIPDYSKYLNANQKVVWYSIKLAGNVWHVDGEIQTVKSDVSGEASDAAAETGTSAAFYLVKAGGSRTNYNPSNYYSLGNGTIKKAEKIQNNDTAVAENLSEIPDYSSYVSSNQKIVWYSIKLVGSVWHVDGEIIDDTSAASSAATVTSAAKETSASTATSVSSSAAASVSEAAEDTAANAATETSQTVPVETSTTAASETVITVTE